MQKKSSVLDWVLLSFLACAPWNAGVGMNRLFFASSGPVSQISFTGLLNFFWILAITTSVFYLAIKNRSEMRPYSLLEKAFLCWPLLVLAHIGRIDKFYFVEVENAIFFSTLVFLILRRDQFDRFVPNFKKYGLFVFGTSLTFAICVPSYFPIEGLSVYTTMGEVERYIGWTGLATYMGFMGFSLTLWSFFRIESLMRLKDKDFLLHSFSWILLVVGLCGIYLAVHRIVLLGVLLTVAGGIFLALIHKRPGFLLVGLIIFFGTLQIRYQGYYNLKGRISTPPHILRQGITKADFAIKLIQKANGVGEFANKQEEAADRTYPFMIGSIINTNGRADLWLDILRHPSFKWIQGWGTGGTKRHVSQHHVIFGSDPHNDYLRILGDHGIFALGIFVLLGLALFLRFSRTLLAGFFVSLGLILFTDNIWVYPVFGYGPLLLAGFSWWLTMPFPERLSTEKTPQILTPEDPQITPVFAPH